jgi:hypothetical protein
MGMDTMIHIIPDPIILTIGTHLPTMIAVGSMKIVGAITTVVAQIIILMVHTIRIVAMILMTPTIHMIATVPTTHMAAMIMVGNASFEIYHKFKPM